MNSYGGVREYSRFWAQSRGVARIIKRIFHCTFNRNFLNGEGSFFSMSSAITPANLQNKGNYQLIPVTRNAFR